MEILFDSATQAVLTVIEEGDRVLDLGAGTGLLSASILAAAPHIELVASDASMKMLQKARQRFASDNRVKFMHAEFFGALSTGPYKAIISSLAIHHLTNIDKRMLFGSICKNLLPGGLFVNVEQVAGASALFEKLNDLNHERHVVDSATPPEEWAAGRERMKSDIPVDVYTQLGWMRDAGLTDVDCLVKDWRFATMVGRRDV